MGTKKRNVKIVNKIQELNLEIDYDKLAEAIVRANAKSEISEEKETPIKKKTTLKDFFKLVGYIILNKKNTNGTLTSGMFGIFISVMFNLIAGLGGLLLVLGVVALINAIVSFEWFGETIIFNIITILFMIVLLFLVALFSLLFRASANEIDKEKDRNYVIAVFSGIVSFVALIVSVISLYKGVG